MSFLWAQVFDLQMWMSLLDQDLRHYYAHLKFSQCSFEVVLILSAKCILRGTRNPEFPIELMVKKIRMNRRAECTCLCD